jgi:hypothetical protein
VSVLAFSGFAVAAQPVADVTFNSQYHASDHLFPNEVCPPWGFSASGGATSYLVDGKLILSSETYNENIAASMNDTELLFPDTFVFEARLKYVSGGYNSPVRGPVFLAFNIGGYTGTNVVIRQNSIFINNGSASPGSSAPVDAAGDFHTYRIEIHNGSMVYVFVDGVHKLTGSTYYNIYDYGPNARLSWGESSGSAYGTSQWEFVRHNASTVDCSLPVSVDIKPGSCPNPLNTRSRGVLTVAVAGTDELNVMSIDPATVTLAGAHAIRYDYEDVATPVGHEPEHAYDCHPELGDGRYDLTLQFDRQEVLGALGNVQEGQAIMLGLAGSTYGGTFISGRDIVIIRGGR